jgi:hypothetical protein
MKAYIYNDDGSIDELEVLEEDQERELIEDWR